MNPVIDRIACDGAGLCAQALPEAVSLDEWGYPIVGPGPIPERLRKHARDVENLCPRLAFHLKD